MDNLLAKLETYVLYAVVFLVPITVLGISPNAFVPAKLTVLSFGVALVLLIRAIRVISSGKLEFSVGSFDFPIFLLAAAYVVSTILRTPNKMEALLLPGTATVVVSGAILYFLLNQQSNVEKKTAGKVLFYSSIIFAVIVLLAFAGLFTNIPQLPAYMKVSSFNPAAGYLPASIFFLSVLPLGVMLLLAEKVTAKRAFLGVANAIVVLALAVAVFNMLPGKPLSPRFPTAATSWSIAIDSLKESPVFGVGPGNYLTAFSRFRPLSYNATDLWPIKFGTANDFYLTALTETGLLGAAGFILLALSVYRTARGKFRGRNSAASGGSKLFAENAPLMSTGVLIILLAVFPATVLLIALFFILLAFTSSARKTSLTLASISPTSPRAGGSPSGPEAEPGAGPEETAGAASQKVASRLPALLVTLPVIVVVLFFFFRASRVIAAEFTFKRAVDALVQNQAQETYDLMGQAINTNPRVDRYHASNAQINFALASSIAQRAAGSEPVEGQPTQITDQDRLNIAQLVQQSIQEGKATVALNPLRASNWELLARIYQAIIPFAQGSDVFAAQTMGQAVALDPINPNLRIALGGIHYGQGNYDTAIRVYELAVAVKPDHANAHYNLAFAHRDNGNIDSAIAEMTLVLSLVDRGTDDYENARAALEDMESRREAATTAEAGETLTPPEPAEEPALEPPLELPEEAEPPEAPVTPTPTPTPTGAEAEEGEEGEEADVGEVTVTPEPTPTP